MHISRIKIIFLIITFLCISNHILAQELKESKFPRGAQYFLGTGDELLIKVNIWGFVIKPGQYLVPTDTDLISLISYAGGPMAGAKLSNIRVVHATESEKNVINQVDIEKFLKKGDKSLIPQLLPGDTIIISGSKWHYFNKFIEVTTKIAMLAQLYTWIDYYLENKSK